MTMFFQRMMTIDAFQKTYTYGIYQLEKGLKEIGWYTQRKLMQLFVSAAKTACKLVKEGCNDWKRLNDRLQSHKLSNESYCKLNKMD